MAASTFPSARLGQGVGQKSLQVAKLPTNRPPSVCLLRPLTQNATRRKEVYLAATLCLPPSGGSLPLLVASAKQGGVLSPGGRAAEHVAASSSEDFLFESSRLLRPCTALHFIFLAFASKAPCRHGHINHRATAQRCGVHLSQILEPFLAVVWKRSRGKGKEHAVAAETHARKRRLRLRGRAPENGNQTPG